MEHDDSSKQAIDIKAELKNIDAKITNLRVLVLKHEGAREYLASLLTLAITDEPKKPDLKVVPHGDNTG